MNQTSFSINQPINQIRFINLGDINKHCTSNSQSILMFFMARKQHGGTEIFARELLPRWCQVFRFVHPLHLHIQYHMEKLRIFIRRIASIQLWPEGKDYKYMMGKSAF